ncbi:Rz1 family lipoprotein [Enterobacter kobei]|nr:Rz1 family lipoprotein [Enterobacter kobei]
MRKTRLMLLSVMLPMALSGCSSTPVAPPCQRVNPPEPPAWMMEPAPDLLQPLNGIITSSESASKRLASKLTACRTTYASNA